MRKKLKTPNHKHAPFAVKTFLSHSPPFIDFQTPNDKLKSSPLDRIDKLTVGIRYKVHSAELLRAHSGERWCRNRPPSTPLPHPAASLCALSAHTLYKAGEVLTYPIEQNKGTVCPLRVYEQRTKFENFDTVHLFCRPRLCL